MDTTLAGIGQYKALDTAIGQADSASLRARWDFGRLLVKERIGKKLPPGRLAEVAKGIGKSETEVKYRLLFAVRCPSEESFLKTSNDSPSWFQVVQGFTKAGRRMERAKARQTRNEERLRAIETAELPKSVIIECARMEDFLIRPDLMGKADAIITDPPYDRASIPLYVELARLAKGFLKPDGVLAVMSGQCFIPEILAGMTKYMPYRWMISYNFPHAIATLGNDRRVNRIGWKPVLLFGGRAEYISDTVTCESGRDDKAYHKWGQSIDGFKKLTEILTQPGQLVVDPFLGSGTTGLAALALKRRFAGCDTDNRATEISRKRIAEVLSQAGKIEAIPA